MKSVTVFHKNVVLSSAMNPVSVFWFVCSIMFLDDCLYMAMKLRQTSDQKAITTPLLERSAICHAISGQRLQLL